MVSTKRENCVSEQLEAALNYTDEGEKVAAVSWEFGITCHTLYGWLKRQNNGVNVLYPGTKLKLGAEMEVGLAEWIKGLQQQGFPVHKYTILLKGDYIHLMVYGALWSSGELRKVWLGSFLKQHRKLSLRLAQVIKHACNKATLDELRFFFNELLQNSVEWNLTADRLYNMDETGFSQK